MREADPELLEPFYDDDAAFYGLAQRSARLLILLMEWGPDRGYFSDLPKSLLFSNSPAQEEAMWR